MRTYTLAQAARFAKVHPNTIRNWIRDGHIPDRRPPGRKKIILLESDLLANPEKRAA